MNQYNTDKQNLEKKIEYVNKTYQIQVDQLLQLLNTKISEVENKIPDTSSLMAPTVPNTKIGEAESKFLGMLNILLLRNLIG